MNLSGRDFAFRFRTNINQPVFIMRQYKRTLKARGKGAAKDRMPLQNA